MTCWVGWFLARKVSRYMPKTIHSPEIMQAPMRRVCARLKSVGVDLASLDALEFFAREGDWQTMAYADEVRSLEAWEINPACEPALKRNLPRATIRIGDSYSLATQLPFSKRFGLVVLDNPQCVFGPDGIHCEHFDALDLVPGMLTSAAVLIFNVNLEPYGYDQQPAWRSRREQFYGAECTHRLELPFLNRFYVDFFTRRCFDAAVLFFEPRHEPMLWYCVMRLTRREGTPDTTRT
jgi:hypothetical protein